MKPYKILTTSLLISSCLFATAPKENNENALFTKAKQNGMMSIPENKADLLKLIDPNGNMITPERVELGKKLYFEPRLSRVGSSLVIHVTILHLAVLTVLRQL